MLYTLIFIIVGFEIISFILKYILPKSKIDSSINSAINMIIFAGIIMLCASILSQGNQNFFSFNNLIWSQDVDSAQFQDYIDIYKQIISNALE